MKSKCYFTLSVLLIISSIILIFVGLKIKLTITFISLLGLFIGVIMLMHWSTISYQWVCDECNEKFNISLKDNVLGVNGGVNYKRLHCPKCNKYTMCKGIKKE